MSEEQALAGSPPETAGYETAAANGAGEQPAGEAPIGVEGGGQRGSDWIPKTRFDEVNSPWQELKQEAAAYGYDDPREYARALREAYETTQRQQQAPEYDAYGQQPDPELQTIKAAVTQMAFQQQFTAAKERFPLADQAEVWDQLSYGRARNLEHAMQASHQKHETIRQRAIAEYQQQQQKGAAAGAEGAGGAAAGGGLDWGKMPADEFERRRQAMGVSTR